MFRVTGNLSTVSSPTIYALKLSAIPCVSFSASATHRLCKFSSISQSFHAFLRRPISSIRPDVASLNLSSVSPFSALEEMAQPRHSIRTCASFSSGSGSSSGGREVLVQHLLVKDDDVALLSELQKRIANGEDMGDLAVEYSLCPSKKEGGMLGWVGEGQMVPEFEEAAFSAPLNKVVRCKTQFGWHLVQVLSEREVLKEIQVNELHTKMQDPSFVEEAQLIDVREPAEIAMASIPGFQVFPLQQFASWAPEITSKLDSEKDTYVMCHHGMRSLQVAKWLQSQGFKRVFNVAGGIHAYAVKADQSVPTY